MQEIHHFYVEYNIFSARKIDLPRKVRYRPRRVKRYFKVDKACRISRTYDDFLTYMAAHSDTPYNHFQCVNGGAKYGSDFKKIIDINALKWYIMQD